MRDHPPPSHARPSFGRSRAVRGFDLFDTPPVALGLLFEHEPLLAGVTTVAEPFCGKGNLVVAMRERGLTVFASDILDRGCPGSTVLDFRAMTERPPRCGVLISSCPDHGAMGFIEHALALGFRVVVLLLKLSFCAQASGSSACTSPGTCGASTSWPSDSRTCTTPTTPVRRPGRAKCMPGSCSIRTAARRRSIRYPFIGLPRACRGRLRSCRQEAVFGADACETSAFFGAPIEKIRPQIGPNKITAGNCDMGIFLLSAAWHLLAIARFGLRESSVLLAKNQRQ